MLDVSRHVDSLALTAYCLHYAILSLDICIQSINTLMSISADRQVHIYSLPSLDLISNIKPIRHVETLAVDHNHLQRPAAISLTPGSSSVTTNFPAERGKNDAIDLCVIKRSTIAMYSLGEEKLTYTKVGCFHCFFIYFTLASLFVSAQLTSYDSSVGNSLPIWSPPCSAFRPPPVHCNHRPLQCG